MSCDNTGLSSAGKSQNEPGASGPAPGDWVKELFAPVFDFDAIVTAGRDGYKQVGRKTLRVSVLNPDTIREVFERVYNRIVETEQKRLLEIHEEEERKQEEKINPRESTIWNTDELDTLRKIYKKAKGEILRLEARVQEETQHSLKLEQTVRTYRKDIEDLRGKLAEATKANKRLTIHENNLLQDQAILEAKVSALTEMWHEMEQEKVKAMEEEKRSHLELNAERLTRQKLELDLAETRQKLLAELQTAERNMKSRYEVELYQLRDKIHEVSMALEEEKKLHMATRKGLEHLRNHFSSLPLDHLVAPNAVFEDEVEHIDHLSIS